MKTKLILSTETIDIEYWKNLPLVPKMHEWLNVQEILSPNELSPIKKSANCWSGVRGSIEFVEYKPDENEFYAEVFIWCED